MALDLVLVERRMRFRYEFGRVKHALTLTLPLVVLTGLALYAGPLRSFDFAVGAVLVMTALAYLWLGQLAERTLLPAIVAGLFPLVFALVANGANPGCSHGSVISTCTAACALGGMVAALRISRFARAEENHMGAFWLAALPTLLLGSLGCGCMGFTGVLAMTGAMLVVSVPAMRSWA